MHNKRTRFHSCVVQLLFLVAITVINVHAMHANFLRKCLQTHEILKNSQKELQNTRIGDFTCVLQV